VHTHPCPSLTSSFAISSLPFPLSPFLPKVRNDPEAAHIVFNADWDITLASLNVTNKFILRDEDLETLHHMNHVGKFLHDISRFYMNFFKKFFQRDYMVVHDSSAIVALTHPQVFTRSKQIFLDVETKGEFTVGVCVGDLRSSNENADTSRRQNIKLLLDIDLDQARAALLGRLDAYTSATSN
jgi:inosine/uridine nucleosidase